MRKPERWSRRWAALGLCLSLMLTPAGAAEDRASAELPFMDVAAGAWYYDDVRYVWEREMFSGNGDGSFSSDSAMSWAMAVQVLYNMAGRPGNPGDSVGKNWAKAALDWADRYALLLEEADPSAAISRQALIVLFYRYHTGILGYFGERMANLSPFRDGQVESVAVRDSLGWAVEAGILLGTPDGYLYPGANLSRAEAAAFFHRYQILLESYEEN